MEPETTPEIPETITIDTENIELLLEAIRLNQESQHQEIVTLTTELVASNYHIRELNNNIMVGLGLAIALAVLWKFIKIFF